MKHFKIICYMEKKSSLFIKWSESVLNLIWKIIFEVTSINTLEYLENNYFHLFVFYFKNVRLVYFQTPLFFFCECAYAFVRVCKYLKERVGEGERVCGIENYRQRERDIVWS